MGKKIGRSTVKFGSPVCISNAASIVGPKEGEGPLSEYFDKILGDELVGQGSWEQAESKIVNDTVNLLLQKSGLSTKDIDYVFAGDLLNQTAGSTFGFRGIDINYFGIYGACSSFGEGLGLGAMVIDGGFANRVIVSASSHFGSAEKQFRLPMEAGSQRPPTSSWTVTGDGCALLDKGGHGPFITSVTTGRIIDMGIKDQNNMGAAMAPAASDTIYTHLKDLGVTADYYDLIITGDLGYIGIELLIKLLGEKGIGINKKISDCGIKIFDRDKQDTHNGGSGCACSAVTFSGYLFELLKGKSLNKILLVPTGALLSPTSVLQNETIPSIAHAVAIENL
ncbi:MAG: stage V sporulation protein AD [Clostridiales bacterium]|nr:stage V sporulation protein AD [Clostridiales bacterium]